MTALLFQLIELPATALAWGLEALNQNVSLGECIDGALSRVVLTMGAAAPQPAWTAPPAVEITPEIPAVPDAPPAPDAVPVAACDDFPAGDTLKLIRYQVVFLKRGLECVLQEADDLIPDNLTSAEYCQWKLAEFMQALDDTSVPARWKVHGYPRVGGDTIGPLPEEDKKYLRVKFEILSRYSREAPHYAEREVRALGGIADAVSAIRPIDLLPPPASSAQPELSPSRVSPGIPPPGPPAPSASARPHLPPVEPPPPASPEPQALPVSNAPPPVPSRGARRKRKP